MEHKSISKHQGRLEGKVRKFSHMCRLSVARLNLSPCSPQPFESSGCEMGEGKPASSASDPQIFAGGSISLKSFMFFFFFCRKSDFEFGVKEYKYRILFNLRINY